MSLTHVHKIDVEDWEGKPLRTDHLDSEGNDFGHDDHVAFLKDRKNNHDWEHEHAAVEERYDDVKDMISLHPVKKSAAAERPATSSSGSAAVVSGA